MRGRGAPFGRRQPQQPLLGEVPEVYEQALFPTRHYCYFSHRFAPPKRGDAAVTIPSIDPTRVQNAKPVTAPLLLAHRCTIFASPGSAGDIAASGTGPSSTDAATKAAASPASLRSGGHAPHMAMLSAHYYYTTYAATPGAAANLSAVSAATSAASKKRSGVASTSASFHGVASSRPMAPLVSSVMTAEANERIASVLPPELVIADAPATWRIKSAKRKRVEKPLRRGGVVTAARPGPLRKPGTVPRSTRDAADGRTSAKEPRGEGADAGSDSGSAASDGGDTDELSSIEGGNDDDEDAGGDGGDEDELTM